MTTEKPSPSCPKCEFALSAVEYWSIPADRCKKCNGLWLDNVSYEAIIESPKSTVPEAEKQRYRDLCKKAQVQETARDCPVCLGRMEHVTIPDLDVTLDRCANDGIWFDEGELQHLRSQGTDGARDGKALDFGIPVGKGIVGGLGWLPEILAALFRAGGV